MRVLVACECSGEVRRAFRARGHDAWSCDILPAEDGSPYHIHGSVIAHDVVKQDWDLLIAHPDCTYLTVSANRWANEPWRMEARHWALAMVKTLWALPIKRKCLENPRGVLPTMWKRPTQSIQPHQFWHLDEPGNGEVKETCLWLDNLPPLEPTTPDETGRHPACWLTPPSKNRKGDRSRTYPGIADAMAERWGSSDNADLIVPAVASEEPEWYCKKYPGCECFVGCLETALTSREESQS
jgi:hypothetical protein